MGQALQFVDSGNAELGLVALAQVSLGATRSRGSRFVVPSRWHDPISQQAVVIAGPRRGQAQLFADFLRGPLARTVIAEHGYALAGEP